MINDLTEQSWDAKVVELGGSILQSWVWGEFQNFFGNKIVRLSGSDFAALGVQASLPLGKNYLYFPRGPLGNMDSALTELKRLDEDHNIVFARLEPQVLLDLPPASKETQPQQVWMLNLAKTEEELLIAMKPKTRYNINLAQRKGVRVFEGTVKDLINLYQLMLETASRAEFKLHPQEYYWQMFEALAPSHAKILIAEYQGQPLAGMILTFFSDTATYLHGGSASRLRDVMAPYLLHWEAIKLAKTLGYSYYDLGGVADQTTHPGWAGLTRFKKSFGGYEVAYPGSFDLVFSPIWYNVYKNARSLRKILR